MPEVVPDFELPSMLVLTELARITASEHFRRSHLLTRLLTYLVHATLAGDTSRLREFNLALECLRRNPSRFDPHKDSSVRVAANRLRQKLAAYYAAEGAGSYVRIELPVGGYIPRFVRPGGLSEISPRAGGTVARTKPRETKVEARDLYDRGRFALRQQGAPGYRKAVELFGRTLKVDPQFAEAWSSLAHAYLGLVGMVAVPSLPDIDAARSAVLRALELDPQLGEAYASLASITFRYDLDWQRAAPLYREAIALSPRSRYAHHAFAFALTMNGRFAEADAEYQIARDLDPLDQTLRCQHALMPIYTGRYEEAEAALLAILDIDQDNILARALLGATYLYSRQPARALDEYQRIIDQSPAISIGWCGRGQALAMLGMRKKARAVLVHMISESGDSFVSSYQVAMVYARLGDIPATLEWLDRAGTQRDANFICAPVDPAFEALRETPAWQDLMKKHGLGQAAAVLTPP